MNQSTLYEAILAELTPFWASEEVFLCGDDYFDRLIQDIDRARDYITVEMYIFNDDVLGKKVAAHLINAHMRGVKVQIIVDGIGSYQFYEKLYGIFAKKNILVKMYNPLPFFHPFFGNLSYSRKMQILMSRWLRLNKRNHRKIVTIDYQILYTGSYNFTAEHTRYHPEPAWKDMGIRVTGETVKFAVLNFKRTWRLRDYYRYRKQIKHLPKTNWRQSPLRLNHTLLMKRYFHKNFIQRIHRAEKRIWFITPYFIPKPKLIRELGKAAKRGVDVRLLISLKTDIALFRTLQFFYYPYLIKAGVKVFQYSDTVLHAKNYIIDDWMTIGSTNLNHRSLIHDLEVDLVIQDSNNLKLIENHFLECSDSQPMITLDNLKLRPMWDRILSRIYFIFRFWF